MGSSKVCSRFSRVCRVCLLALLGWLLAGLWSAAAQAHPMPESRMWLDTTSTGLVATLDMPLDRLEIAYGQPLAASPGTVLQQHGEGLKRYLLQHVGARSGNQGWQVLAPRLQVVGSAPSAELQASFVLRAPPGADPRTLTLWLDAVTHEIRTHRVLVFLRNDWAGGRAGEAPLLLGAIRNERTTVAVTLPEARAGAGFTGLLKAGAMHIAEGTDHLLFLLMLVIVAPLAARAGRWDAVRPVRSAIRRLAVVVTAFTVGHSVTLALGSTGVLVLPSQPVEVAVAVSIAFAAVHAFRPLFAAGEVVMALGFGLIHGFAFSASLSGGGLTVWQHAQALLAFNLGIEAMQLVLLATVLPALLLLSLTSAALYAVLRRVAAVAAFALAALWVVERLGLGSIGTLPGFDGEGLPLAWWPGLLWLVALGSWLARARGKHVTGR